MKKISLCGLSMISLMLLVGGCNSDLEVQETTNTEEALYLRGDMNDYAVSETYRLKPSQNGLCTEAALHADWSPYHFKFADAKWSKGHNYGYAMPPGSLEEQSRDLKLNPNSKFEDVTLRVRQDGVYRFCLLRKDDGSYASVSKVADGEEKTFESNNRK